MLSERALEYYEGGFNCAQCILKACAEEYSVEISDDCYSACEGLYNGLGVGGCCGVLIACIMAVGILCDDVPFCRLEMVERFNSEFMSLNCCKLKRGEGCEILIEKSCNILDDIIDKGRKKY